MNYFQGLLFLLTFFILSAPVFAKEEGHLSPQEVRYTQSSILETLIKKNDSLYDVLAIAYQNNPTIRAARAELKVVEEQLAQAQSGFLPNVTANADILHTDVKTDGNSPITSDGGNVSKSASINLTQPVFRGGSTYANIAQAKNIITVQRFALSAIEQEVLYNSVVAYMDLYQNRAVLALQENNARLLKEELEQAQARFTVGELTKTDVSQSEARLASATAAVADARSNLASALAIFRERIGGEPPSDLGYPVIKFKIPENIEEALALSQTNNREIIQAQYQKKAANSYVKSVKGELLPQVNAIGTLDKVYDQSDFIDEQRQAAIGLTASVPLYSGGATRSRIREAKKSALQRHEEIHVVQERVKQEVISNWSLWQAAKATIKARMAQVEANKVAQEGVEYELEFGERTTLDALNAHQELLEAQVELIQSKRNEAVAGFSVARSLGLLVPQNLGFSTVEP